MLPHVQEFSIWTFCNMIHFYGEEMLAPRPTPKLEDHPVSAVRLYVCVWETARAPIPVAAWSKAQFYSHSPAAIVGSNPTGGHGCLSVVSVVYCPVEVSVTDWSLVQGRPTDCGASLCVIKKPRKRGGYSPARGLQNTNP